MRAGLLVALVALGSAQTQAPQTARDAARPPQIVGTGSVGGVVNAVSGNQPVRRALVSVNGSDITTGMRASRVAVTDDRGRFAVPDLPAGRYTVTVTKGGWLTEYYGSKRPGRGPGSPVALADGEHAKAEMKLVRGAVVTGRIVDENGHPQTGVRPQLMEYRTISGQRRLVPASMAFVSFLSSQTNDLGEYRLFGVPPGSYILSAQPSFQMTSTSGARMTSPDEVRWALQQGGPAPPTGGPAAPPQGPAVTYAPVFYAGVTDAAAATMVTVAAGEEKSGIDIVMGLVATARIQGTITRPDGQPARGAQVNIMPQENNDMFFDSGIGMRPTVDPQGRFTFPAVRPGRYTVVARAPTQLPPPPGPPAPGTPPARPTLDLWGLTDITVEGRDITGLSLTLQPGLNVSGRIVYEASTLTPPASLAGTRVMMASAAMLMGIGQTGTVSAAQANTMFQGVTAGDGTFTFAGVMPGPYMVMPPASSGWMMKSTTVAGREVPGAVEVKAGEDLGDIVITFTDKTGEISGTLLDAAGRPAPEYFVFVFPAEKGMWTPYSQRLRPPMRPASDGKFRISPLPAGEYYMVALTDFEQENLYDATFLEQVAAASFKVTLGEGEKKVQDIKIR